MRGSEATHASARCMGAHVSASDATFSVRDLMIRKRFRFSAKVLLGGVVLTSLARAEKPAEARQAGDGLERRLTAPLPPAVRSGGVRMPGFIALPGGPPLISPKHAALGAGTTECVTHCVERRSVDPGMSRASVVLAGVASAGLATGIVLVLAAPGDAENTSLIPAFRLRVSGQRALASARWRF
jgi:hypothetical protein